MISIDGRSGENYNVFHYTNLLLCEEFWKRVIGEHVLLFQTDSIMLRRGIDEFLTFDFVGAPHLP